MHVLPCLTAFRVVPGRCRAARLLQRTTPASSLLLRRSVSASCGHHDLLISVALAARLEPRERLGARGHVGKLVEEPIDLPMGSSPVPTRECEQPAVSKMSGALCYGPSLTLQ